jgi:hypothetical protein
MSFLAAVLLFVIAAGLIIWPDALLDSVAPGNDWLDDSFGDVLGGSWTDHTKDGA